MTPLFFPGGDIGELAVNGTVNDLAMSGARPLFLSAAFIMEEGLPMEELSRVVDSMAQAARAAGVAIVTGDTKVVNRGSADKLFITTSGVGLVPDGVAISASNAQPGDDVIISGSIADHGMAVMSVREGLEFEGAIAIRYRAIAFTGGGDVEAGRNTCPPRSDARRTRNFALRDCRRVVDRYRDRLKTSSRARRCERRLRDSWTGSYVCRE